MGERTRELFVLITGDILLFIVSLWLTLFVRYFEVPSMIRIEAHFGPFLLLTGIWLFIFYISGLYDKHTIFLKNQLFARIVTTQIVNILLAALIFIIVPFEIAPKTNLVIYLAVSVALIALWRLRLFNYFSPKNRHKAILIADGPEAIELVDEINNNDRYNYSFVRLIDEATASKSNDFEAQLLSLIDKENIKIIVADPRSASMETMLPAIFDLSFLKFEFTFLDFYKVYEDTFDRVPLSALRYDWFITHVSQSRSIFYDISKRALDIVGALVLLFPAALLFPFVAAAIKLEDGGSIFYVTQRIGQFNRPIKIYKLRTKNGADSGAAALKSELVDTKVGSFLRKTRIDELPQLLSVLMGDQSFIGPRPEMPALASVYAEKIPYYNVRHFLKPGLSGWAQINNFDVPRGGVDVERTLTKISYDLYYIKRRSFTLDLQIAAKTISIILRRTGT